MMKYLAVVALTVLAVVAAEEKYTTKFDGVDVQSVLKNERLLQQYFNCIMEKGKCSPDGEELKKHIPEALSNDCAKCSARQRAGAEQVLQYLYEKKQDLFKQMEDKYDANGTYREKYQKKAAEKGIKL